ncbi:sensor histidine kinase [Alcanivorax quisquiliarum]|uniref:histidine kinase n=1 Tax=Alcanivorax quisquiliarum TaxID=2933565 RepID=A0ABT0E9B4_9GAMM|nr:HAMP domain-containing sensor histidine kinase [Alcanivorax quisquiliarum]MCK0538212.1 HAMP domain-containing histidine kinase [Alcanivorax quisquiliarum]
MPYLGLVPLSRATLLPQGLVVSHVVLMLSGMAVRISSARRLERNAERERLRVAAEMHTLLEHQVAERTTALRTELQARRQAERKLNDMLSEQRSFLAMVSHEFRTPLAVMGMVAHNIGARHEDNAATCADVARATRANQRLLGLVDACLNSEWLDSAEMRLRLQWQDVSRLLRESCEQRRHASGREITLTAPVQPVMSKVDAALIQVVFDNLIGNALKYARPDSPVLLSVRRQPDGAVEIAVADQGPGVPPDEQAQVFERYYRSPGVLSHSGIGIGLHIVKRIVTLHDGTVWLDARYREGARFVVRLPPSAS